MIVKIDCATDGSFYSTICYLLCPPPSHVTHDRLDNLAELAVLEAVEDEVEAAVEDDQEVGHRHRDLHEVAPQRLLRV